MQEIASQVHPVVTERLGEIAAVCERFGVRRLEVFGSASGNGETPFDPGRSDVDFLISDETPDSERLMGDWPPVEFALALERLLGRSVDVVYDRVIRNPYFRRVVDDEREVIYDVGHDPDPAAEGVAAEARGEATHEGGQVPARHPPVRE